MSEPRSPFSRELPPPKFRDWKISTNGFECAFEVVCETVCEHGRRYVIHLPEARGDQWNALNRWACHCEWQAQFSDGNPKREVRAPVRGLRRLFTGGRTPSSVRNRKGLLPGELSPHWLWLIAVGLVITGLYG